MHVRYMVGLLDTGVIVMDGPFPDEYGGRMISRSAMPGERGSGREERTPARRSLAMDGADGES